MNQKDLLRYILRGLVVMKISEENNYEGCPFTRVVLLRDKIWFKWYHLTGKIVIHIVLQGEQKEVADDG